MGLAELIELLANSKLPLGGSVIIVAWILKPVFFRLIDVWATHLNQRVKAEEQRVKAEEKRADNEDKQTGVLAGLEKALNNNTTLTQSMLELLSPIAKIPERMDAIGKTMTERASQRDELVREQGREQALRMSKLQEIVAKLPEDYLDKSVAHFDPKLASIQRAIDQLREQIESKPDVWTPDTVRDVRAELARIARLVTALSEKEQSSG